MGKKEMKGEEDMYKVDGEKIYCVKTGKLVAEIQGVEECNGNLMFMPGMVMQHKKKLKAWFKDRGVDILQVTSRNVPDKEQTQATPRRATDPGHSEGVAGRGQTTAREEASRYTSVAPRHSLARASGASGAGRNEDPPFDKALGVKTPGFAEWAEGRSQEEVVAMVRKLEVAR